MKVVLVYPAPSIAKPCRFGYSLNLLYLAAILREAGYSPEYVDFSLDPHAQGKLHSMLPSAAAVVVERDSFPLKRSDNVSHAEQLIQQIRRNYPKVVIVACGYDCILKQRSVLGADFTYTSEPEVSIVQVIDSLTRGVPVNNISIPHTELKNLDVLPFPARDLIPEDIAYGGVNRAQRLARSALIQTSRGCPGLCRFCQRKGWQKGVRYHSIDYVVREFCDLQARGVTNVWVTDDNFPAHLLRAKKLLAKLAESRCTSEMRIAMSVWAKIDLEFLDLAKAAGVSIISLGLESADKQILDFYRKEVDYNQVWKILSYADSLGIFTVGNFIIGAPMESDQTIEATFRLAHSLPIDEVNMKILTYMPGSELFESLPDDKKKIGRALFACRETGLNPFPLEELRSRITHFYTEFRKHRIPRLIRKIKKHGFPYCLFPEKPVRQLFEPTPGSPGSHISAEERDSDIS